MVLMAFQSTLLFMKPIHRLITPQPMPEQPSSPWVCRYRHYYKQRNCIDVSARQRERPECKSLAYLHLLIDALVSLVLSLSAASCISFYKLVLDQSCDWVFLVALTILFSTWKLLKKVCAYLLGRSTCTV